MPEINRDKYPAKERRRHNAAYKRLLRMIESSAPDAEAFRQVLGAESAAGFPADWPGKDGWTLLHEAVAWEDSVRAGLPQVLIDAGADVNARTADGDTPLGDVCWRYVRDAAPECLATINALLVAGARSELDESWKKGWEGPGQQARRDRLEAYITSWPARRAAQDRGEDATPSFDYAL